MNKITDASDGSEFPLKRVCALGCGGHLGGVQRRATRSQLRRFWHLTTMLPERAATRKTHTREHHVIPRPQTDKNT